MQHPMPPRRSNLWQLDVRTRGGGTSLPLGPANPMINQPAHNFVFAADSTGIQSGKVRVWEGLGPGLANHGTDLLDAFGLLGG